VFILLWTAGLVFMGAQMLLAISLLLAFTKRDCLSSKEKVQ
jgi:hypothetical protein